MIFLIILEATFLNVFYLKDFLNGTIIERGFLLRNIILQCY